MRFQYTSVQIVLLLVSVAIPAGGKESADFLESILGKQLKDPSDYVATKNTWSLFNVFSGSDTSSGDVLEAESSSKKTKGKASASRGEKGSENRDAKNARASKSSAKTRKKKSSGDEWSVVQEDGSEEGASGGAMSRGARGGSLVNDQPLKKAASAAGNGGLLPTAVYVINRDAQVDKWVQFRGRWSIVHQLSDVHRNNSAPNPALSPVRFRAADLVGAPISSKRGGKRSSGVSSSGSDYGMDGAGDDAADSSTESGSSFAASAKVAWARRLDVLPPKARRVALECRNSAVAQGPTAVEALSYAVSHLALWESLAMNRDINRDSRLLILDDGARPRQNWHESLELLETKVPKDWDVLLLGWWGHARSADRVQGSNGAVFHARPPFRKRDGGRQGEGPWQYYYAGSHARLIRGRVLKRLVNYMSQVTSAPRCKHMWPDADLLAWAHSTTTTPSSSSFSPSKPQPTVGCYAVRERLFGVGDRLASRGGSSSSTSSSPVGERGAQTDDEGARSMKVLATAAKGIVYDEFERWVSQPAEGLASPRSASFDSRGSFSGQGDDDDDDNNKALTGHAGEASSSGTDKWKAHQSGVPSDFASSKTVRKLRAKLPPDVRCRTIVNHALGTEREACQ